MPTGRDGSRPGVLKCNSRFRQQYQTLDNRHHGFGRLIPGTGQHTCTQGSVNVDKVTTRSNSSRERILACAESIILQKGFTSTSIDDILEGAAISKGGFFYHFDGKAGLAQALIERYLVQDDEIFRTQFEKADRLSEDPLQQLLIFLNLMAELMGELDETHPGCLVASFTYESFLFDENIRDRMRHGLESWRNMMLDRLRIVAESHPTEGDVSIETLADMFTGTIEGGILLARNFDDNQILVDQILAYRAFLRMHFGAR